MKSFTSRLLVCLIPLVIAGTAVGWAFYQYQRGKGGFQLGVDLVGGTILVYEVDLDKFPGNKLPEGYEPQKLVTMLKRRIDPADLFNITIRPVSASRVEIILPTGGSHQADVEQQKWNDLIDAARAEFSLPENVKIAVSPGNTAGLIQTVKKEAPKADEKEIARFVNDRYDASQTSRNLTGEKVQQIKELISRQGSLEFRILANDRDDREAITAAQKWIEDAKTDARKRQALEEAALLGKAPPPPEAAGNPMFSSAVSPGQFTYSWIELGRSERHTLGLDNAAATDATRTRNFWSTADKARAEGKALVLPGGQGALLYSREIPESRQKKLPPKDRDKKYEYFFLTRDPEKDMGVTGDYLVNASPSQDRSMKPAVSFRFNSEGGQRFYDLTSKNAPEGSDENKFKRSLAIVLDGLIMSAPTLNDKISTDGQISGNFTGKEVNQLVDILRSGALPATLKRDPVSENTMGPTLGADTIRSGTISVLIAFVAILVFMAVYYRFAGLVACVALLANLVLTVAFMVLVNATFTLPGLAGLVLMLGMAVDANVLIYERLREERDRGASLALAIRNGYDRAFPTIIDTHLSSIFTAIVLYVFGNDQLKGFGVSLTVGLIISLFTSLYMTRLLFDLWLAKGWLHKLSMFRLFSKPNIDFMGIRYYWFTATILLTLFGITVFVIRGKQGLNIDFVGGTAYGGKLVEKTDIQTLRGYFSDERQKEVLGVQDVKQLDQDGTSFEIIYNDGATRRINVPKAEKGQEKVTSESVKARAGELPDWSVEQIFVSGDPDLSEGSRSKLFTIRTSEKAAELVQTSVDRLLGNKLQKIDLAKYTLDPSEKSNGLTKGATLEFANPENKDEVVYGSPAQVAMLLQREFQHNGLESQANQVDVQPADGADSKEGRYSKMHFTVHDGVTPADMEKVLAATKSEFASRPQPERLENFDSQLAADTQKHAFYAILASWGAILLYLWFRFGSWTFGMAAVLCLMHDLFFTLGIIALSHYIHQWAPGLATMLGLQDFKIDLPAVAALLTLVGYSVNDTIVVFDRIREVRGKNPDLTPQTINDSVNQTLSRTLLTSFATWLVVIVLYIWGGAGVHLFAFVMVVGVVVGTYSSIYIASPLLLIFGEGSRPTNATERQPRPVPEGVNA